MKCSYDKTFTLTTNQLQAPAAQSVLGFFLVRSVECGLLLSSHSVSLQRNQFFYQ
jgi:hypothetical protein